MNRASGKSNLGVTLLELLLAISILTISILAIGGLQQTTLSTTSKATRIRDLSRTASSVLEQALLAPDIGEHACSGTLWDERESYQCKVTVNPCSFDADANAITCAADLPSSATDPALVMVEITHPLGAPIQAQRLWVP